MTDNQNPPIRRLTQEETDLLHHVYTYRRSPYNATQEEWELLLRLSREFPRPMPTEETKHLRHMLAPITDLLARGEVVTRAELQKAIAVLLPEGGQ